MYIKDCGYGRSKRCRVRVWPVIGMCVLALGLGSITIRVMAGQSDGPGWSAENPDEITEMTVAGERIPEEQNAAGVGAEVNFGITENPMETPWVKDSLLVVIDPGHGGEDEGCSRENVEEKSINLQIGLALRDKLVQMGYQVLMTREDDSYLSLEERVTLANNSHADAFISIHQNACEDSSVSGIETWYHASSPSLGTENKRLAQLIHQDVILYTKKTDRDLWENDTLYVIRETQMPSCLVETGFLSSKEDRDSLTDAEYQGRIAEGIASGIDLYFHPKTMYLTFDDGPSVENTCAILDILKQRNIKATFFVVGENVEKNPEVARRIVAEGHTIGIHCNSHDYREIYQSVDSYIADFEKAYETVYEVTGVKAELFRFPGGSINSYNKKVYKEIIEEMTNRGFVYFDWNASLEDAVSKSDPAMLIQNARESTLGRKRVVMLAHDIVHNTALCLDDLIEQFPEYKMEPLTIEVEPVQF